MKAKTAILLLVAAAVALAVALYVRHAKALKEKHEFTDKILQISNSWTATSQKLDEQHKVNLALEQGLSTRTDEARALSNNLAQTRQNLEKVETESKAAAEQAKAEIAQRDQKISALESQKDDLTKRMTDLHVSITGLEGKIAETEKKLTNSEGQREYLLQELKRLQAEKAELERQFNDLVLLREQVRKLKDELSFAKRIELIRRGLYGPDLKGGQRMQQGTVQLNVKTNYDLSVEIKSDGGATVVPPATNAPPAK